MEKVEKPVFLQVILQVLEIKKWKMGETAINEITVYFQYLLVVLIKFKKRRKNIMRKSDGVLALTCLVAVFAILMVLTPGYAQVKKELPPTPSPVDVSPTDLPKKFNQLQIGMTTDQVQKLLGFAVTIIPMADMREWKYYLPGGKARLFLYFKDNKIESIKQLTP